MQMRRYASRTASSEVFVGGEKVVVRSTDACSEERSTEAEILVRLKVLIKQASVSQRLACCFDRHAGESRRIARNFPFQESVRNTCLVNVGTNKAWIGGRIEIGDSLDAGFPGQDPASLTRDGLRELKRTFEVRHLDPARSSTQPSAPPVH